MSKKAANDKSKVTKITATVRNVYVVNKPFGSFSTKRSLNIGGNPDDTKNDNFMDNLKRASRKISEPA